MSEAFSIGVINIPLAEVFARLGAETREDRLAIRMVQSASLGDFVRHVNPTALSAEFREAAIVALEKDGCLYGLDEADARATAVRSAWTLAVPGRVLRQRRNRAAWLMVLARSMQAAADRERTLIETRMAGSCGSEMPEWAVADAVEYGAVGDTDREAEVMLDYARECTVAVSIDTAAARALLAVQIALAAAILSAASVGRIARLIGPSARLLPRRHRLPHLALAPRLLARPRTCRALIAAA